LAKKTISKSAWICCRHFNSHTTIRFTVNTYPGIILEQRHISPSTRRTPQVRLPLLITSSANSLTSNTQILQSLLSNHHNEILLNNNNTQQLQLQIQQSQIQQLQSQIQQSQIQ
jgi:hypothetical protein